MSCSERTVLLSGKDAGGNAHGFRAQPGSVLSSDWTIPQAGLPDTVPLRVLATSNYGTERQIGRK